jgi:deoxyadenosine/deoxycytidine kinase
MKIISIDGNIASGKSTILKKLENAGFKVITEGADDDNRWRKYLELFYQEPKRWCFVLQLSILEDMITEIEKCDSEDVIFIERSSLASIDIFVKNSLNNGHLSDLEFSLLHKFYERFSWKPDKIILLEISPTVAMSRIKVRARPAEKDIPIEYLKQLDEKYQEFAKKHSNIIIKIDAEQNIDTIYREIRNIL